MSVVEIKNRVVHDEKRFQEAGLSDRSLLFLDGGLPPSNFSVELSVGRSWSEKYGASSTTMYEIGSDGLAIARHGSIVVEVAESIKVPHNMYGLVVPTGSLFLDRGVLIAPAKVEPSFHGTLKLRLFNTTGYKHTLKIGDKIASIVFFSTENTSFQQAVSKSSLRIVPAVPPFTRLWSWASRNIPQIATWVIMIGCSSLTSTALTLLVVNKYHAPTQTSNQTPPQPAVPTNKGK